MKRDLNMNQKENAILTAVKSLKIITSKRQNKLWSIQFICIIIIIVNRNTWDGQKSETGIVNEL